ncbi:unnamed protein product, partial [Mesorhabditis belari]|uniref:PH domain-containing protein n=1 Tax=Mesorhabditis belari TaxID=2138241 RepID=A0AAF3ESS4_9BILA
MQQGVHSSTSPASLSTIGGSPEAPHDPQTLAQNEHSTKKTELSIGMPESLHSAPHSAHSFASEQFIQTPQKKENLKQQKREYKDEKKRVAQELMGALRDPTVVVMADWLKLRGSLRKWNRHFCVLKPGLMLVYKNNKTHKHGYWVGTVLLNSCELIERPSKKDGFCFKLYHPLDQSIWATRGPLGESHGAVTINPLPTTHLICRAPSDQAGRTWMDALELSLRCSGLLMRTMHNLDGKKELELKDQPKDSDSVDGEEENISETEAEKHFVEIDENEEPGGSDGSENGDQPSKESHWIQSDKEQFGQLGEGAQTEGLAEENKSLVWTLLKQVRPGMDLSKVVLPTFILEPRSFLEKLADYYYHADLLTEAANEEDPLQRMIAITKFYLSGFYKKPKGLKKPYNPILGETFRCCWHHADESVTYYIAEQVSHHPPISSLFITNKKAGFNVSGTILAKSKYYGNSLSAMMLGSLRVTLLKRGETYTVTLPYANCKGIMIGTLTMELGGQVTIECDRTAYSTLLDFQLKPLFGGSMNKIKGEIKYGSQTISELEGHWDGTIKIKNSDKGTKEVLWQPTAEIIGKRLHRYEIPYEEQGPWESKKLWNKVTAAIANEDQYEATNEKTVLEEEQRRRAKSGVPHKTKFFKKNPHQDVYDYIYADYIPWDSHNDIKQIENDYEIRTVSKVKPKTIRNKISSVSSSGKQKLSQDGQTEDSSESSDEQTRNKKQKSTHLRIDSETAQRLQETLEKNEVALHRMANRLDRLFEDRFRPSQLLLYAALFSIMQALLFNMFLSRK